MVNRKSVVYFPPDVEWVVEDARSEVKPGCVAAFSSVSGTVEVIFEVINLESRDAGKPCFKPCFTSYFLKICICLAC